MRGLLSTVTAGVLGLGLAGCVPDPGGIYGSPGYVAGGGYAAPAYGVPYGVYDPGPVVVPQAVIGVGVGRDVYGRDDYARRRFERERFDRSRLERERFDRDRDRDRDRFARERNDRERFNRERADRDRGQREQSRPEFRPAQVNRPPPQPRGPAVLGVNPTSDRNLP